MPVDASPTTSRAGQDVPHAGTAAAVKAGPRDARTRRSGPPGRRTAAYRLGHCHKSKSHLPARRKPPRRDADCPQTWAQPQSVRDERAHEERNDRGPESFCCFDASLDRRAVSPPPAARSRRGRTRAWRGAAAAVRGSEEAQAQEAGRQAVQAAGRAVPHLRRRGLRADGRPAGLRGGVLPVLCALRAVQRGGGPHVHPGTHWGALTPRFRGRIAIVARVPTPTGTQGATRKDTSWIRKFFHP
jgi:hypothetical protein